MVHIIPCAECPHAHIGQTGRSLDHQLREHHCALKNRDVAALAVPEHVFLCNYKVDLSKTFITMMRMLTQIGCHCSHGTYIDRYSCSTRGKRTLPELYTVLYIGLNMDDRNKC